MDLLEAKKLTSTNTDKPKFHGNPSVKNRVNLKGRGPTNILYTNLPINASENTDYILLRKHEVGEAGLPALLVSAHNFKAADTAILIKSKAGMWSVFATTAAPDRQETKQKGLAFYSSAPWIYLGSRTNNNTTWFPRNPSELTDGSVNAINNFEQHRMSRSEEQKLDGYIKEWVARLNKADGGAAYEEYLNKGNVFRPRATTPNGRTQYSPLLLNYDETPLQDISPEMRAELEATPLSFYFSEKGDIRFVVTSEYRDDPVGQDNHQHFQIIGDYFGNSGFADAMAVLNERNGFVDIKDISRQGAAGAAVAAQIDKAMLRHMQQMPNADGAAVARIIRSQLTHATRDITRRAATDNLDRMLNPDDASPTISEHTKQAINGLVIDLNAAYVGREKVSDLLNKRGGVFHAAFRKEAPRWTGVTLRSPQGTIKTFLFPPNTPDSHRRMLLAELMQDYHGWVEADTGKSNPKDMTIQDFDPTYWALGRSNLGAYKTMGGSDPTRAPAPDLVLKLALKNVGNNILPELGLKQNGTLNYVENDKVTRDGESFLARVRNYNEGHNVLDAKALNQIFPATSPALQDNNNKIRTITNLSDQLKTPSADDPLYRRYDSAMVGVVAAMEKGAGMGGFGATLQRAFPQGLAIRGYGVAGLYMFDEAGLLYKVNADDPQNTNGWKHVPPQIFKRDSEYLQVLKHLASLARLEYGDDLYIKSGEVEAFANKAQRGSRALFEKPHEKAAFVKWYDDLNNRLAAVLDSKESPLRKHTEALMAFPTMDFTRPSIWDEQTEKHIMSRLTTAAIRQNDQEARRIISQMHPSSAEARDMAFESFHKFSRWVHASYLLNRVGPEKGKEFRYDTGAKGQMPLDEAEKALQQALVDQLIKVNNLERGIFKSMQRNMPLAIKNNRERFADDNLMGLAGNALFDHIIDPIYNWIRGEWDYICALYDRVANVWRNPGAYVKALTPKLMDAAYDSLKLFFRRAAGAAIDTALADEDKPTMKPDGVVRAYSFSTARKKAYDFMDHAMQLRPLSVGEQETMSRLASTKTAEERMEDRKGRVFGAHYKPTFRQDAVDFIKNATGGAVNGVELRAPITAAGKNPKATIKVVVNISNFAVGGITQGGVADDLRNAPPGGWVITSDGSQKNVTANATDNIQQWWVEYGRRMQPTRFDSVVPSADFPDGDVRTPRNVRVRMGSNNVAQVEMEYSLRDLFGDRYADIYARIYGRRLTANKNPTYEMRTTESDRKVSLIHNLFFAGLKGA